MALSLLGSATCFVLDFVRTEPRTMLAMAFSDRIDRAMQPLASRKEGLPSFMEMSKLGGSIAAGVKIHVIILP